jgi:hypothetical protein
MCFIASISKVFDLIGVQPEAGHGLIIEVHGIKADIIAGLTAMAARCADMLDGSPMTGAFVRLFHPHPIPYLKH